MTFEKTGKNRGKGKGKTNLRLLLNLLSRIQLAMERERERARILAKVPIMPVAKAMNSPILIIHTALVAANIIVD